MPVAKVMASRFGGGGEPEEDMDGVLHLDASDPRVAVYQNLKERDVAGRGDLFILEGENSVHNLVQHGRMPLESVCVSERRVAPMKSLIAAVRARGVPVYALTHEDYSGLVGFNFHRGRTNNLDNVGAVFRNGAAFGAGAVVFDGRSADPYYRKSIRVSGGHALAIPFTRRGSIADVVQAAKASGHVVCALVTPSTSARSTAVDDAVGAPVPINEWRADDRPERVAVLMGAEGPGLTDEAQRLADVRLTIPMANAVDSVNVATACSIALHARLDAAAPRRPGAAQSRARRVPRRGLRRRRAPRARRGATAVTRATRR
ncbi:glucosylceramidase [Aureococcus anophagefferens]|nr:glucosylceramidase [Aureococcus anophagefferens]